MTDKKLNFENLKKCSDYIPSILQKFNSLISEFEVSKDINEKYFNMMKGQTLNLMIKSIKFFKMCLIMDNIFNNYLKLINNFSKRNFQLIDKSHKFYHNYKLLKIYLNEFCSNITSNILSIKVDSKNKEELNLVSKNLKNLKNDFLSILGKILKFNKFENIFVIGKNERILINNLLSEMKGKIISISISLEKLDCYQIFNLKTKKIYVILDDLLKEILKDSTFEVTVAEKICPSKYFQFETIKSRFEIKINYANNIISNENSQFISKILFLKKNLMRLLKMIQKN